MQGVHIMEFTKISNQDLLNRLDKLVHSERKLTHVILCHINEVESRRLYAELGFESMFSYLTRHCGYGEDSAYRRLQAARLLKKNPIIATKLEQGVLNLTQLTQVQKCLKQESKAGNAIDAKTTLQIIEQIENKSSFDTKKILAVEFNLPVHAHEVLKPQRDDSVRLELTLSAEQMKMLEQVKSLLSHSLPDGSWSEVITYLADKHLQKVLGKDHPFKKQTSAQVQVLTKIQAPSKTQAQTNSNANVQTRIQNKTRTKIQTKIKNKTVASTTEETFEKFNSALTMVECVSGELTLNQLAKNELTMNQLTMSPSFMAKRKRAGIKISLRRKLLKKANYCCEYVDQKTNHQCQSHYQLQIDHQIPFAHGGSSSESNLRIFCRSHNLLAAKQCGLIR